MVYLKSELNSPNDDSNSWLKTKPINDKYTLRNGHGKNSFGKHQLNETVAVEPRLRLVLLLAILSVPIYKLFKMSMPSAVETFNLYAKDRLIDAYESLSLPKDFSILVPILAGLGFSLFSYIIVFLDSSVPGVFPPTPFSPNSSYRRRRQQQRKSSIHMSYMMAIGSGFIVTTMMYCNS